MWRRARSNRRGWDTGETRNAECIKVVIKVVLNGIDLIFEDPTSSTMCYQNAFKREPKSNKMSSPIDRNGRNWSQNCIQNAPGGCPWGLWKAGRENRRPEPEKTLQFLIQLWIWSDFGYHFGSKGVPLGCHNLHFFIKYMLGALKNWFSDRSKKNIQKS